MDDDEVINEIYRDMLRMKQHRVIGQALDGEDAVRKLRSMEKNPDIVILDHRMPIKSGFDTMADIRSMNPQQGIVFVTVDFESAKEAVRRGANSFILKPFRMENLFGSIELAMNDNERKKSELKENMLSIIAGLGPEDMGGAPELCARVNREVVQVFTGDVGARDMDGIGRNICALFNMMGLEYSYSIEGDRMLIRNKKCHWMDTLGPNPLFCFTTKSIIAGFFRNAGMDINIRTRSAIMDNDSECLFEIVLLDSRDTA